MSQENPIPIQNRPAPSLKALATEKTGALKPSDTVETAGDRMRELDAETLPVAENRKLVGVVDEKNPDRQIAGHGHDPKTWTVGEIMSRNVIYCHEDEDGTAALRLMVEHDLDFLPVVDSQMRIVRIFTRQELSEGGGAGG